MNARSTPPMQFPPNPIVGQIYLNWVWNGSAWVCKAAGPVAMIKTFTTSQTYFPSPGCTYVLVDVWGAGGGGGGARLILASGTAAVGGGGGGGGAHSRSVINAGILNSGVIITIGAGGAGGIGATPTNGGAGGDTSFGALVTAHGGSGAFTGQIASPNFILGYGGPGGPKGAGDLSVTGNNGGIGGYITQPPTVGVDFIFGGMGGSAPSLGGVGQQSSGFIGGTGVFNGNPAVGPGAGGGGGTSDTSGTHANGGAGGPGLVSVMEFVFGSNAMVQNCGCGCGAASPCAPPAGFAAAWAPFMFAGV